MSVLKPMTIEWSDDLLAVTAHTMLNHVAVIGGLARNLQMCAVSGDHVAESLDLIVERTARVTEILVDLARGTLPELHRRSATTAHVGP